MLHNVLIMPSAIQQSRLYIRARFRKEESLQNLMYSKLTLIGPCRCELESALRCSRYSVELRSTRYYTVFYVSFS